MTSCIHITVVTVGSFLYNTSLYPLNTEQLCYMMQNKVVGEYPYSNQSYYTEFRIFHTPFPKYIAFYRSLMNTHSREILSNGFIRFS